jgi:hypothetical protein
MIPSKPDILPLLPFFHVDLHQAVDQQYPLDPVMRDMNPACSLDLILQMSGPYVVGVIGFEFLFFHSVIDWLRLPSGLPEYRIFSRFSERVDELIHALTD